MKWEGDLSAQGGERGRAMLALMTEMFPWHRAIMGAGLRRTLDHLAAQIPLTQIEVPTGQRVFDWTIPSEWHFESASIVGADGRQWLNGHDHNLHVVSYSQPFRGRLSWEELKRHLHTCPEHPDWIPYRSTTFREAWGFCLSHTTYQAMASSPTTEFDIELNAAFRPGSLTLGEYLLPGTSSDEVLLYAHTCHPSLANDNLSGIAVGVEAMKFLARCTDRYYSYRLVLAPATIGAIAWLALRAADVTRVRHGFVLSLLGHGEHLTFKRCERENAITNRVTENLLRETYPSARVIPFSPWGYDERQFNSPGFRLPVGRLSREEPGKFVEYHTSADNLERIDVGALADSWQALVRILARLDANRTYLNRFPWGEPMLGERGLYRAYGEALADPDLQQALLWVLNQADGQSDLETMSCRAEKPFAVMQRAAQLLVDQQLIDLVPFGAFSG